MFRTVYSCLFTIHLPVTNFIVRGKNFVLGQKLAGKICPGLLFYPVGVNGHLKAPYSFTSLLKDSIEAHGPGDGMAYYRN